MALQLRYVAHSEIGLVRKNNQDSGYASPHLLLVADGMGGAAAGDLASAVAVDVLRRLDPDGGTVAAGQGAIEAADPVPGEDPPRSGEPMLEALSGALHRANDRIADLVTADGTLEGMGTTVTGALFDGREFGLVHLGDSRAYLLRDDHLERLTHDHSWVQSLVDDGRISEEEAALHPHRSLLLKVLNGQPAADPDLTRLPTRIGDRLLFCSDGLCGLVEDSAIEAALQQPDLEAALADLVEAAREAGGIDNITAIAVDVVDGAGTEGAVVLGAAENAAIPPAGDRAVTTPDAAGAAASARTDTERSDALSAGDAGSGAGGRGGGGRHDDADDEARYRPRAPARRRRLRPLVGALVVLLLATTSIGAGWAWTRSQFYVGAVKESVAIFQGVADALPGLNLSHVYEIQELAVASLPPYYQEKVRAGIAVPSLEAARQTIGQLAQAAQRCATGGGQPGRAADAPPAAAPQSSPPSPAPPVTTPAASSPAARRPNATAPAGPPRSPAAPTTVLATPGAPPPASPSTRPDSTRPDSTRPDSTRPDSTPPGPTPPGPTPPGPAPPATSPAAGSPAAPEAPTAPTSPATAANPGGPASPEQC